MKAIIKKYPEILILSIVVLIADSVIVFMWRGDVSATAVAAEKHTSLDNDAKSINSSEWRVNGANANLVKDEVLKWEDTFNKLLSEEQVKYKVNIDYDKTKAQGPQAKQDFKNKIEKLSQEVLRERDKTINNLSFKNYAYENTILTMTPADIQTIFEVLKGFEELVNICVKAEIMSLDSVNRPKEITYEVDSQLNTKRYTYELSFTADSDGMKKFLNMVTQTENYFFDILSCKIEAENQVTVSSEDIVPTIPRVGNQTPGNPKDSSSINLDKLPDTLGGDAVKPAVNEGPVILNTSVAPFNKAIYKVNVTLDWVQFVKEN